MFKFLFLFIYQFFSNSNIVLFLKCPDLKIFELKNNRKKKERRKEKQLPVIGPDGAAHEVATCGTESRTGWAGYRSSRCT
jgi:hypothetical protein